MAETSNRRRKPTEKTAFNQEINQLRGSFVEMTNVLEAFASELIVNSATERQGQSVLAQGIIAIQTEDFLAVEGHSVITSQMMDDQKIADAYLAISGKQLRVLFCKRQLRMHISEEGLSPDIFNKLWARKND